MNEWNEAVSWSKASTYEMCPRQFQLQYVKEVEEEESQAMEDGINFHGYMDEYYSRVGDEPTDRVAVDLAKEIFDEAHQAKYYQWIRNWHAWNKHLYDVWGEEHWKPVFTEKRVEVEIDDNMHHGYIDRIQWDPKRQEYGVIDYKPNAKDNSRYKGQVAYYGEILLAAADILDETPTWGGIYGYKGGKFKRWDIHWASTKASNRKVDALVNLSEGFEPDFGMHCDWCGYMDECNKMQAESMGLLK